jgi:type VI secretion system protein ImpL
MKAIFGYFKRKWVIHLVGVIALCALIWFLGPKFVYANKAPLEPDFNRLMAILAVIVCFILYSVISQARAARQDKKLMAELSAPQVDPAQSFIEERKREEAANVGSKLKEALQKLKETRSKGGRDKQYLHELPWYIIIGFPGCGKTTLLFNSGLRFPLSGQMEKDEIPGTGGTRNCDWLFAEEAVFIDTAGRYTSQDSHQTVDAAGWKNFLELLKKYRPRRPINGVLATMSIEDLILKNEEELRRQARVIRQRIVELHQVLNVRFPIYMLFTKCDMVAGFTDFFAPLSQDERAQVWGETFPDDEAKQGNEYIEQFDANFDKLVERLNCRILGRIQDERDIRICSRILDFPHQVSFLRPAIKVFLEETFCTTRFDEFKLFLRGVYFTSGTQVGKPIDRIMTILAATYKLEGQEPSEQRGKGKSYFITRLLKDVVFPEALLVGSDLRIERSKRRLRLGAFASLLLFSLGVVAIWSLSYARNQNAIELVETRIKEFQNAEKDNTGRHADLKNLLARLTAIQNANAVYEGSSGFTGFGLYQGEQVQDGIRQVYTRLLEYELLPLVKGRLEHRIYAILNSRTEVDSTFLYELLKVYLMFGYQERMEPMLAKKWIDSDWQQLFYREPQIQEKLCDHSDELLTLSLQSQELDEQLIAKARHVLNAQPLYKQIYAQLQTEALMKYPHNFRLQDLFPVNSGGDLVFTTSNGQSLQELTIPGLFTFDGYHEFFRKQGLEFVRKALRENWVLNNYAANQESELYRLYDDLQKLYFDQYQKQWHNLLDCIEVKKAKNLSQMIQFLDILSRPDTPLLPLLKAVEKNTSLTSLHSETEGSSGVQIVGKMQDLIAETMDGYGSRDFEKKLEQEFEGLNSLVRTIGESPPPLDNFLKSLSDVRDFLMQIDSSAKSNEQALAKATELMKGAGASGAIKNSQLQFDRLPEPLNRWCSSITSSAWKSTLANARSELNAKWKNDVLKPWTDGLRGRYPLYKDGHDATMNDFSRFFMPNGIIDRFFNENLKDFVDTNPANWQLVASENQNIGLSSNVLRQFQYASEIRDNFFPPGESGPAVEFLLKAVEMDTNIIRSFRIDIEGQILECKYVWESEKFKWPGPRPKSGVRLIFQTVDKKEFIHAEEGPWAWLKILERSKIERTEQEDRFNVTFRVGVFTAQFELHASSVYNPFGLFNKLQKFSCPESL